MEREWQGLNLTIVSYRETGTGIIKGLDDINILLDEQITMTQTIMFSAFKGPSKRGSMSGTEDCAVCQVCYSTYTFS